MIREMHRVHRPDFDSDSLQWKDSGAVSNVAVSNAGLNRQNRKGHGLKVSEGSGLCCAEEIVSGRAGAASRLEEWVLTLMRLKRRKVTADPELFRTYQAITEASRDVVAEHIRHLILQLTEIIRNGTEAGEWNVRSPTKAAEAILNATIVFHHPAFVSRPGPQPIDASARDTLKLLIAGLKSGAI